jgi:hypothetical protein
MGVATTPPAGYYGYPGGSYGYPAYGGYQAGYGYPGYAQQALAAAPAGAVATPSASPDCRTFHGDATIDASQKRFYGSACLEADGRWHIVPQ